MTIRSLIFSLGSTIGDAARAAGVDAALFDRIDAGRQPLPLRLAKGLAGFLRTETATVLAEAYAWTASDHPIFFRPVPGIPGVDFLSAPAYAPPAPPPTIRPDLPAIFTLVSDLGAVETTFARVGRHAGEIRVSALTDLVLTPRRAVAHRGLVWTAGEDLDLLHVPPVFRVAAAFDPATAVLVVAGTTDLGSASAAGLVVEPATDTLWAGRLGSQLVSRIDPATGDPDSDINVAPDGPVDLAASDGLLFVLTDAAEIWVVDPAVPAVLDAVPLPGAGGAVTACCSAGDGLVYVANRPASPRLRVFDVASSTVSEFPTTGASLVDPKAMAVSSSSLWVSDDQAGELRLVVVDRATGAASARVYAGASPGGVPVFDGLYVWIPVANGRALKIHPTTLEVLLEVPDSEGTTAVGVLLG